MRSFDKLTAMIQDAIEAITRAVKQPLGSSLDITLPAPEDGKAIVWNGTSGAMQNAPVDAGAIENAIVAAEAAQAAAEAAASVTLTMAQIMEANNPIGTVRTFGVATNPATLLGFTSTWVAIAGKVIVGIDATQAEFDTLNATGGSKTVTLDETMIPAHTHSAMRTSGGGGYGFGSGVGAAIETSGSTGGGLPHNNLQPYIVKYVWQRTA